MYCVSWIYLFTVSALLALFSVACLFMLRFWARKVLEENSWGRHMFWSQTSRELDKLVPNQVTVSP
jgi:hypothetical protein